jgi:ribonuclease Z
MVPTKQRNHISILLNHKNENILIDCGENAQRQLRIANISPTKITRILITHWDGDHVLGLPGLIQTLAANEYNKTLHIYGPKKSKKMIYNIMKTYRLKDKINFTVTEIKKDGLFLKEKDFSILAYHLKHTSTCLGYSFIEGDVRKINIDYLKQYKIPQGPIIGNLQKGLNIKYQDKTIKFEEATYLKKGKKISIILDTLLTDNCYRIAKDSDLLICEATYANELENKAKAYKHLTAKQAAQIAKFSNVKKLVLTHFSQRYKSVKNLEKEAKKIFKNTIASKDFMTLSL